MTRRVFAWAWLPVAGLLMGSSGAPGGGCGSGPPMCQAPDPVELDEIVETALPAPVELPESSSVTCADLPIQGAEVLDTPGSLLESAAAIFCDGRAGRERSPYGNGARDLYFLAICGANPEVLEAALSGEGRVFEVPADLAEALDEDTAGMRRVNYVYVRGGGLDRPTIVIPFADGAAGRFWGIVSFDTEAEWTAERVAVAERYWNLLPYEYLRRAATRMHHAVLVEGDGIDFNVELFGQNIPFHSRGGLAYPFGYVMFAEDTVDSAVDDLATDGASPFGGPGLFAHELAHMNHYYDEGITPFMCAGNFGSISRRNRVIPILNIPIPFWFTELPGVTRASFVTDYARNGEFKILEDYAETLTVALSATQRIGAEPEEWRSYQDPAALYESEDCYMLHKQLFMREKYTYDPLRPEDADRDGATFNLESGGGDCDDLNPASDARCQGEGTVPACPVGASCGDCLRVYPCGMCDGECVLGSSSGADGRTCGTWTYEIEECT